MSNKPRIKFILPPKGSLTPDGLADPLPYYYHPIFGKIYRKRVSMALSLLNERYESVLELGYGSGIMLPTLCTIADSVKGIDIESDPIKVFSNINALGYKPKLILGNAEKTHYKNNEFDLVVAISIMEHIKNFDGVIKEVFRILKPGGHFLVGMPRVSKSMEYVFDILGFPDIEQHHITSPGTFKYACMQKLNLAGQNHLPSILPKLFAVYHNMLFEKPAADKRG